MPNYWSRCSANFPDVSMWGRCLRPLKSKAFLCGISGRRRRQTPWSSLEFWTPQPIEESAERLSLVSFTVTELPRRLAFPIKAEAIPGPKPATRLSSRLKAFSTLLFSGALIAKPPGIAALIIFLSALTRAGDPTYVQVPWKKLLPVVLIWEFRMPPCDGGFPLVSALPPYCERAGSGEQRFYG